MIAGGTAWLLTERPPEERRLSALFDLFTEDDVAYRIATLLDKKEVNNRAAKASFCSFLQLPGENTRPTVLASALTHLRLFDTDTVRKLTDTSTIDLDGFIAGEPMSLYIIVPPIRLQAYRPLLRIWISCLMLATTRRKAPPKERTLMLCDEIGNLGRIDALLTAATLLRSWGLTLWTFWQNAAQLQLYESQANTLVDNAGVIQAFGVRNMRMAQDFVNLIGGISSEELMKMPSDHQVLLVESRLVRCRQTRYYDDKLFAKPAPASYGA